MAYKYSKGEREFGDIEYENDPEGDTKIDFEDNYIGLVTSGSTSFVLSGSKVGIGTTNPDYRLQVAGNIGVNQYIYHNGDANTWINFTDNRIRLNAGGNNFIDCEDPGSAPHKVRINNGGNNIDFVIKNNSNSVYFAADASTSRIGIGTDTPTADLTINGTEPRILFTEGGADRAEIFINDSDNLLINNMATNKHIVFKVNDNGVVREGLRINGMVPEIVVNEGSDSLVDFRVESDSQTHMLFVDGGNNKVGIRTSQPNSGLHVDSSFAHAATTITQSRLLDATDHTVFVNAPANSTVVVSLPTASGILGRQYIIKRIDSNNTAQVTIDPDGSETLEGSATPKVIADQNSVVIQSDGSNWWIVSEFITPP